MILIQRRLQKLKIAELYNSLDFSLILIGAFIGWAILSFNELVFPNHNPSFFIIFLDSLSLTALVYLNIRRLIKQPSECDHNGTHTKNQG